MRLSNIINKRRTVRLLANIAFNVLTIPFYIIGFFIPKKNKLWILGNYLGEKDNSFHLFQYITKNTSEINAIWISKNNKKIHTQYNNAYHYLSPMGIYYQYIAGVSIHTTGLGDFAKFTGAKKYRVQLWHGIPIKKILLDSVESIPFQEQNNIAGTTSRWILRTHLKTAYSLIIASSETVKTTLMSAFNQPEHKVAVTGYPRHDIILKQATTHEGQKRILYAPTWRPNNKTALNIITSCIEILTNKQSNYSNQHITVSIHPLNQSIKAHIQSIPNISLFEGSDINTELGSFDTLITDYSSIALDFLPLQREVIFYTPDLNSYSKKRGIYPDFFRFIQGHQILPESPAQTDNSSIELAQYFKYTDTNACKRIVNRIKKDTFSQ